MASGAIKQAIKIVRITTSSFDVNNNANTFVSVDATLSGYKAVGIVGITGSNNSGLAYYEYCIVNQTDARVYVRNISGTDKTGVTLKLDVLYVPS